MKSTGIVRKIDNLGRLVIPIELRRTMNIDVKDALEVFVDDTNIILSKYAPACVFCGEADSLYFYKNKKICLKCISAMSLIPHAAGNEQ